MIEETMDAKIKRTSDGHRYGRIERHGLGHNSGAPRARLPCRGQFTHDKQINELKASGDLVLVDGDLAKRIRRSKWSMRPLAFRAHRSPRHSAGIYIPKPFTDIRPRISN